MGLEAGVPQGSTLGPILYICDVDGDVPKIEIGYVLFIDDVKMWISVPRLSCAIPGVETKIVNFVRELQNVLDHMMINSASFGRQYGAKSCVSLYYPPDMKEDEITAFENLIPPICWGNRVLPIVRQTTWLGVILDFG